MLFYEVQYEILNEIKTAFSIAVQLPVVFF